MRKITIVLAMMVSSSVYATVHEDQDSWAWYNDAGYIDYSHLNEKYINPSKDSESGKKSATERLADLRALATEITSDAVLNENDIEKVAKDMAMRKYMMDKAEGYGISMQKALLKYPQLSTQNEFPTQQFAQQIYQEKQQENINHAIDLVSKKYGLFFFYDGKNKYAQGMSESLQGFADQHEMYLMGVSMDGVLIPTIKHNELDDGQAHQFGVKNIPAVFIYDDKAKKVSPVAYGFVSTDDLGKAIYNLATNYGKEKLHD